MTFNSADAGRDADRRSDPRVLHAIGRDQWAAAVTEVRPPSLAEEGFIHLSTRDQIAGVCTERFGDRDDLVLLVVDPGRLPADLVWEDCDDAGQVFPHLYAALPTRAVTAVIDYVPGPGGRYHPPHLPAP